jgi:LDH2 family malate/lactate/ureidoglycolate dehydrogenase
MKVIMERHQPTDAVRLTIAEARQLGEAALKGIGYSAEQAEVICDHLVEAASCGYPFAGLPRILTINETARNKEPRTPIRITHETGVSALIDGGNQLGYWSVYQATQIAIEKAKARGFAVVGLNNSNMSGRNGYYVEKIVKEGFVAIHACSASPLVAPLGGMDPLLGTNPFCIGFPSPRGPVVYDIGTASVMLGELILRSRLGEPIEPGLAMDAEGRPTTDAAEALKGAVHPWGGHKGYGLSFAVQALGLLAGAAMPRGKVIDYGFLFIVFEPGLLMPREQFLKDVEQLIETLKGSRKRPGVEEILIPSERAFRTREVARREGIAVDRKVYDALRRLAGAS